MLVSQSLIALELPCERCNAPTPQRLTSVRVAPARYMASGRQRKSRSHFAQRHAGVAETTYGITLGGERKLRWLRATLWRHIR